MTRHGGRWCSELQELRGLGRDYYGNRCRVASIVAAWIPRAMIHASVSFDTFSNIDDARQWRNRAEEMRMVADEMISVSNKAIAQRLADSYERLAKQAE